MASALRFMTAELPSPNQALSEARLYGNIISMKFCRKKARTQELVSNVPANSAALVAFVPAKTDCLWCLMIRCCCVGNQSFAETVHVSCGNAAVACYDILGRSRIQW